MALIYGLYIIIDLMAHIKYVVDPDTSLKTWVVYYLALFAIRLEILLPFAILIAAIRCLILMTHNGESIALLSAGVSKSKILMPFLAAAAGAACLLYINYACISPYATTELSIIQEKKYGTISADKESPLHEVLLNDGSKLIYKHYNPRTREFEDTFLIISADAIFHCKTLSTTGLGKWVDKIERRKDTGLLEKTGSWPEYLFTEMELGQEALERYARSVNELPLYELVYESSLYRHAATRRAYEVRAMLWYKMLYPLIIIIAFIGCAPFCLRFSRSTPLLMIYLVAIAALFCINILMAATFTLAKSGVYPAFLIIGIPWAALVFFFGRNYAKYLVE